MPIDVRMPDGTLVTDVPDNITQADLMARFDAFKAQPVTSAHTVAPEIQVTPQAPQVGPEGAPIPSVLQTQPQVSEDRPAAGAARKGVVNLQQTVENLKLANLMELQDAYKQQYGQDYENAPPEKLPDLQKLEEDINTSKRVSTSYDLKRQTLSKQYGITPLAQKLDDVQSTPEYQNANGIQKFQAIGETLLKNPSDIPSYIGNIGLESLPNSMAMMASAVLARFMTGSPTAAAAAGGASSSFMEFGNQYVNARDQGKTHQDAMAEASVKSGVIGYFDAVSFNSAGKALEAIVKDFKKGAIKATAKEVGKETGKQAGYGAAGEAVGSVITGQEVDPRAVVEEALGEIAGAPMEAVTTYRSTKAAAEAPKPPPISERIEPEVTPIRPRPEEVPATPSPIEAVTEPTKVDTSHDTQAMLDELAGKDIEYVPEKEDKVAETKPKETIKEFIDRATPEELEEFRQKNAALDMSDEGRRLRAEKEQEQALDEANKILTVLEANKFLAPVQYVQLTEDLKNGDIKSLRDLKDYREIYDIITKKQAEPEGVITEEDKKFTPVGGRLINKADAARLARESAIALQQNLATQEAESEATLKREIREEKFREPPTQTLSARLVQEGGIARSQKRDMLGETGKISGYDHVFRENGGDLLTMVKDGLLDDYLPPNIRSTATPPDGLFDARPGYNYISDLIGTGEKVHHYDYEMAKIQHENMVAEKNLAKQQMTPNEAAQAAAAEEQGKEYLNIEVSIPKVTEQELLAQFSAQAQEYISEMPIFESAKETKSFKIEMNKLRRAIKKGMVNEADIIPAIDQIYESTQKEYEPSERIRGAEIIKEKLLAAKRRKELSPEAVDMALFLIDKNPALVKDLAISITASKRDGRAGGYAPLARLATIFKYTPNNETAVHEILHHLERMMPKDIQAAIRKAWSKSLSTSAARAFGGTNETLKQYYRDVIDYHTNGDEKAEKRAMSLLAANTVGYEHYQNFNPSEFWAINGSSIVQNRYNADISESMVERIKNWLSEFVEKVKALFNLKSDAAVIRALNSVAKGDGKFITDMIHANTKEYANIQRPPRNIRGQEVLPQWHGPEESKIDTLLYNLQDKQIDTKRVQQAIGDIEEDWNVYEKEQLYHGRTAAGIRNFLLKELLPVIKEIERLKISPEDIRTYLHNRHAEERNIQMNKINPDIYDEKTGRTIPNPLKDKGSGISTADAKAYLTGLDPARKQVLEQIATKFDQMVKGTQQILISSGAESSDTIAKWNKTYKHYVPLFRVEDEMARPTGMGGTGQGFGVRGAFSKRAMGSEKDVQDILSNIIAQRERALIRAEKIRVGRALYGLAIQNPNSDFWLAINPDAIRNKKQAIVELRRMGVPDAEQMIDNLMAEPKERYLKKTRAAEEGFEPDEDFDFDSGLPVNESKEVVASKINVMARYKDFVFPVRINGKDRYIFFNKNNPRALRMVQSLKNLDVEQLGLLENIFGKFTRWFKNVNTQYNPVFGLVNFLRDMSGTLLNLTNTEIKGKQAQVIAGAYKAMGGILNVHRAERKGKAPSAGPWAKLYQEYRDEGSQTGYRDSLIRNQEEMQIIETTLSQFKDGNTKKAFYAVLGGLTDYNDMMENAFRLSAYKVALDQGLSKQKAAIIAKNLTVNFDKKGAKTAQVNALYAFFNASVQGTERIYQTLKGPKGKIIIGGGILAGMVQAVMLASAGYGDDDPPEFVRERNFIVPLVDGTYITIPYPLGYNLLPNSGRIVMDFMIRGGRDAGKHMTSLMSAMMNSLNPLGSSGFALQTMMPTAIDPVVAIAENKDSFGRPIARKDRATAPTPGYTRSRDTASTLGKGLAEFLNWASGGTKYQKGLISPTGDEVDFLAGQIGGGLYREISKAGKAIGAQSTGEALAPYQRPIVSRFYGETGSPAAVSQTFYNNVTRMTDHENEIKGRMKNREDVEGYLNDNPEARLWKRANTIENKVNELNKRKRMFIERGFPKERIQAIDAQKTLLMQRFNDQVTNLTPE